MFTQRDVSAVLGVSSGRLRSYVRAGIVEPLMGDADGQPRFTFQDLVLLRKAEGLVGDRVPARRVTATLRKLRERLPGTLPLSQVHLATEGSQIVANDGRVRWQPDSGQTLLDFKGTEPTKNDGATVTPLVHARRPALVDAQTGTLSTQELYDRACALEESAPLEAQAMYRQLLLRAPRFADAHVNLGRLLHEAGETHAALIHYRAALSARPEDATAAFNIGVALEDLGSVQDAIEAYGKTLTLDASNADAHYNMARLLEQQGKPDMAIRHLLLYRQLTRRK